MVRHENAGAAQSLTPLEVAVTDLRYPVGKFTPPASISESQRTTLIDDVSRAPAALRAAVAGLTPGQLDTPYRPGGWTVRQVVHHVPDSHINAYVRFKQALSERTPTIKPYDQDVWVTLPDTAATPVDVSLALLDALHARWVTLLRAMRPSDFERGYDHPEYERFVPLSEALASYAWHGRHHVAHITSLRERNGW